MVDLSESNSKRSLITQIADLQNQAEYWRLAARAADSKSRIVLLEVVGHLHNAATLLEAIRADLGRPTPSFAGAASSPSTYD